MKIKLNLYDKIIDCKAYKIKNVKKALYELGQEDEENTQETKIDILFNKLIKNIEDIDIKNLTMYEKLYIMLTIKSKIDEDNITITHTCDHCKSVTESVIKISEFVTLSNTSKTIRVLNDNINIKYADSFEKSINTDIIDILPLVDAINIEREFNTILCPLNINAETTCILCDNITQVPLTMDFMVDLVLPLDLENFYWMEVNMKLKGYSLNEIENMYPYELQLYSGMYDKLTGAKHE
jgi:hypothetical protein